MAVIYHAQKHMAEEWERERRGEGRRAVSELSGLRPSTLSTTQSSDGTRPTNVAADGGVCAHMGVGV